jgi:uncharacterized integral membrane protein
MTRIFIYFLLLILAITGATLAKLNGDSVVFNFYFSTVEMPLVALLYIALTIGALSGVVLSLAMILDARREASRLRKRLAVCEQEIKNLREIPIKGQY